MNNRLDKEQPPEDLVCRIFSRNPREREVLQQKHIVIVGTGSVGSAIALMAGRAGVGKFTLIDPDELAPENVCRHFCDLSQIGRSKAYAVSELIRRINPQAAVTPHAEDFRKVNRRALAMGFNDGVLLAAATDSFECQSLINQLSIENGIPAIYIGCWGEATIGEILYVVPGRTPCFVCFAGFRRETEALSLNDPRKYTDLDFDQTKVPGQAGLWPNILIILGLAFQVIPALLGAEKRVKQL